MKKIGLITKEGAPGAIEILRGLIPWLEGKGLECVIDEDAASALGRSGYPRAEIPSLSELVVVFGGDGTMLSVARLVCEKGIPILGVNLGGLGFITEVGREQVYEAMERVLAGDCPYEERMMLNAVIRRHGEQIAEYTVLNDVVLIKGATSKIINIETVVDGDLLANFRADGLIASTPTGSTAYSLSAGGPVLYPTVESIVLTPICSHMLAIRPIVLPPEKRIEIKPITEAAEVFLSLDGQVGFSLRQRDVVLIAKSPFTTKLLLPFERDYFQVLRKKLRWGG
jgi:NAD+ kinase